MDRVVAAQAWHLTLHLQNPQRLATFVRNLVLPWSMTGGRDSVISQSLCAVTCDNKQEVLISKS